MADDDDDAGPDVLLDRALEADVEEDDTPPDTALLPDCGPDEARLLAVLALVPADALEDAAEALLAPEVAAELDPALAEADSEDAEEDPPELAVLALLEGALDVEPEPTVPLLEPTVPSVRRHTWSTHS